MILAVCVYAVAAPAFAQTAESSPRAMASLTIERSLRIATVQQISFNPVSTRTGVVVMTPYGTAIIQVTGDPGRVYRVTFPADIVARPGNLEVDVFTVISDNSGDITHTLTARMNSEGYDRLEITSQLRQPNGIALSSANAAVPIGVDYE